MSPPSRQRRGDAVNLSFVVLAGVAFGFVEAAVVYYLRALMDFHKNYPLLHYKVLLNLGFITFITPKRALLISAHVTHVEEMREFSTIVLLIAVAYLAGKNPRQRLAAFLVSFACWDITYYVFLKIIDDWPSSFLTKDVFFLIPVTWIGPVLTPLIISSVMLVVGARLYLRSSNDSWR
ncbi:MAG: hypothetical protein WA786_02705 [Acidimicrobiales bacterium]